MAMTIVDTRTVIGGVDTHLDVHVAAALDGTGGLLGVESFPTTPAGYKALFDWLDGFGPVAIVGVEGTGSYGAGLARFLSKVGVTVVEVDRADRSDRHRQGKSDRSTPSAPRAPPSRAGPGASPRVGTERSRRSASCWSPNVPPAGIAPRPSTRCGP
jgi:transposase